MTKKIKYLRNRPFLCIDIVYRPARGVKTEKKGWISYEENWDVQEIPHMEKRINNNVLCTAALIIDVSDRTLIKNRFDGTAVDKDIIDHFIQKYSYLVQPYIQQNPSLISAYDGR